MGNYYRVRLLLCSPLATPLHSGTLFGHLCWAWRALYGESSLKDWLRELSDEPFLISDAMEKDEVPRPLLKPRERTAPLTVAEIQVLKKLKARTSIDKGLFLSLRNALNEEMLLMRLQKVEQSQTQPRSDRAHTKRRAHNTIDRRTGRTPDSGGLYFTEEEWTIGESRYRDVYVYCQLSPKELSKLFGLAGCWGYGKDATSGRGRFEVSVEVEATGLFGGTGTRRMSLSRGTLTPNMLNPRYRLRTHYGKLGGLYAMSDRPFKYPLSLLLPGATFGPADDGPYGQMLDAVHPHRPEILQNAWHLTVPFTEAE